MTAGPEVPLMAPLPKTLGVGTKSSRPTPEIPLTVFMAETASILNPKNIDDLESLVRMQKAELEREEKKKELYRQFGLNQGESNRFNF